MGTLLCVDFVIAVQDSVRVRRQLESEASLH